MLGALACLVLVSPVSAQVGVVIHGRVEDAVSREPVPGARVFPPDSSSVVFTDSLGTFYIPVPAERPLAIQVERRGYLSDRFDVEEDAPSRISILLLEPSPIELAGITVVDEAALTVLVERLEERRNAYPFAMSAFDRARLERFAPMGTVLDFAHQKTDLPPRVVPHPMLVPAPVEGREVRASSGTRATA